MSHSYYYGLKATNDARDQGKHFLCHNLLFLSCYCSRRVIAGPFLSTEIGLVVYCSFCAPRFSLASIKSPPVRLPTLSLSSVPISSLGYAQSPTSRRYHHSAAAATGHTPRHSGRRFCRLTPSPSAGTPTATGRATIASGSPPYILDAPASQTRQQTYTYNIHDEAH